MFEEAAEPVETGCGKTQPCHFEPAHRDLVHEVVFDVNGRRLATCSSDYTVAIWDRQKDGDWKKTAYWKVHGGPVWRVAWAHPEFGQVIATCSTDRSVHIWEEVPDTKTGKGRWKKKAYFADSRCNVTDIKFAPRHLGLMIATASASGQVRVYEAPDHMNLSTWSLMQDMDPFLYFGARCGCIAWSTSRLNRPLLAVGSDDPKMKNEQRIVFYEYHENIRRWQAVHNMSFNLPSPVLDIAFSPNAAADFHQIAIASQDVHIYNIMVPSSAHVEDDTPADTGTMEYKANKVAVLGDLHKAWRLSWNVTGNTISASSSDGTIRVWKSMFMNRWALLTAMGPADYGENEVIDP